MRLGTFNILHGLTTSDGRVEPGRLAEAVAGLDLDVLAMQEVDRDQPRSGGADLTAIAAAAMGPGTRMRFAAAITGPAGGVQKPTTEDEGGPAFGVALLTRWPVRSWHLRRLAPPPTANAPIYWPGQGVRLIPDQQRVLLAAVVDSPVGVLTVAATHLSFSPGWNLRQLRQAMRALRTLPGPRLLLGDLNMPGPAARAATGWRTLGRARTYPAEQPRVQLDHVLLDPRGSGPLPPATSVQAERAGLSDHRPLVVQLG